MPMTDFLKNDVLDNTLRGKTRAGTNPYVGLLRADPVLEGVQEPTGGYARQAATFDAPASGVTQIVADITFGPATSDWGAIPYFGIFDASSGGNLLYWGKLTDSPTILTGNSYIISAGRLEVSLE